MSTHNARSNNNVFAESNSQSGLDGSYHTSISSYVLMSYANYISMNRLQQTQLIFELYGYVYNNSHDSQRFINDISVFINSNQNWQHIGFGDSLQLVDLWLSQQGLWYLDRNLYILYYGETLGKNEESIIKTRLAFFASTNQCEY